MLINGRKKIYLTTKTPLYDLKRNVVGLIGVSVDITERKKAERELEQSDRTKTDFIANMEHDIRTPLGHIITYLDFLLESTEIPQEERGFVECISISANRLLGLVDEILIVTDSSTGTTPVREVRINLYEIIKKAVELFNIVIKQKGLDLIIDYDNNIPENLLGDNTRIHRIIINLLSNAVKFTDQGYVKITAKKLNKKSNGKILLELGIEDTGIGIPEDKKEEIFDRFVRLDPANRNRYKGLGLGLSIVKQFLDDIGGEKEVESVLGKGTKVTCILPIKVSLLSEDCSEE